METPGTAGPLLQRCPYMMESTIQQNAITTLQELVTLEALSFEGHTLVSTQGENTFMQTSHQPQGRKKCRRPDLAFLRPRPVLEQQQQHPVRAQQKKQRLQLVPD